MITYTEKFRDKHKVYDYGMFHIVIVFYHHFYLEFFFYFLAKKRGLVFKSIDKILTL